MSGIIRRHTPQKLSDFKGNPSSHLKLLELIKDSTTVLIVGPPGSGKTACVYAIARDLGLVVLEYNSSDDRSGAALQEVLRQAQQYDPFGDLILLLDEVDGISGQGPWAVVKEILTNSKHPIAMTANEEREVPDAVKNMAVVVKLRRPNLNTVISVAKGIADVEIVLDTDFTGVTNDFRSAINMAIYGGDGYKPETVFASVGRVFTDGDVGGVTEKEMHWMMDNAPKFLTGLNLYDFYKLLSVASRARNMAPLRDSPRGKLTGGDYVSFPTYYRARSKKVDE